MRELRGTEFRGKVEYFSKWSKNHPKGLIVFIATIIFFPLFFATFSLIDDHEIFLFLTKYKVDGFVVTMQSLAWFPDLGPIQRFRPTYYFLRVAETFLWQDKAIYWVVARLIMATFFALSVFRLLGTFLPNYWAVVGATFMLCAPWTSEVFFRYGPAESYAAFFTGLLIIALVARTGIYWLGVSFSVAMLVGIKENFFVFIPLLFVAIYYLYNERKYISAVLALVPLLFSLLCLAILFQKLTALSGIDIYGQDVGGGRLSGAANGLFLSAKGWISMVLLGTILFAATSNLLKFGIKTRLILLLVFVGAIFNLYFYGDVPILKSRYAFPYWPMILVTSGFVFWQLRMTVFGGSTLAGSMVSRVIVIIVLLLLGIFNEVRAYQQTMRTLGTENSIHKIVKMAADYREIIVNVGGFEALEQPVSIARYLDFYQVHIPRYLSVDQGSIKKMTPLMENVIGISNNGNTMHGYKPLGNRRTDENTCLEVYFHLENKRVCNERILIPF